MHELTYEVDQAQWAKKIWDGVSEAAQVQISVTNWDSGLRWVIQRSGSVLRNIHANYLDIAHTATHGRPMISPSARVRHSTAAKALITALMTAPVPTVQRRFHVLECRKLGHPRVTRFQSLENRLVRRFAKGLLVCDNCHFRSPL